MTERSDDERTDAADRSEEPEHTPAHSDQAPGARSVSDVLAEHREHEADLASSDKRRRHAVETDRADGADDGIEVYDDDSEASTEVAATDPSETDAPETDASTPGPFAAEDLEESDAAVPAASTTGDKVRTALRGVGQTLITLGVVVALFIVYEAFITDIFNAQKQSELREQLENDWEDPTVGQQETTFSDIPVGDAMAVLRIPAFGADYGEVVVQGTTAAALELGPGHYTDSAGPGEIGNFAIAGHRVGKGSPFLNLDKLKPGDAIVIETEANWYIYRVIGDPTTGDFTDANYPAPGQEITTPQDYAQVAPVPGDDTADPTQALLTLTTCHPKFSAAQRMIIHAYLDGQPLSKADYPKPEDVPALQEG